MISMTFCFYSIFLPTYLFCFFFSTYLYIKYKCVLFRTRYTRCMSKFSYDITHLSACIPLSPSAKTNKCTYRCDTLATEKLQRVSREMWLLSLPTSVVMQYTDRVSVYFYLYAPAFGIPNLFMNCIKGLLLL